MKREKYLSYKFNEKFEYTTYLLIGKRNVKYFFSKVLKNSKKKYLDFDRYSEWEKYFIEKFSYDSLNSKNFVHYLNKRLRIYRRMGEMWKTLAIPAYILEGSILMTMLLPMKLDYFDFIMKLLSFLLFLMVYCSFQITNYNTKAYFMEDCINIIKRAVNE